MPTHDRMVLTTPVLWNRNTIVTLMATELVIDGK